MEIMCTRKGTAGSNPALSASQRSNANPTRDETVATPERPPPFLILSTPCRRRDNESASTLLTCLASTCCRLALLTSPKRIAMTRSFKFAARRVRAFQHRMIVAQNAQQRACRARKTVKNTGQLTTVFQRCFVAKHAFLCSRRECAQSVLELVRWARHSL